MSLKGVFFKPLLVLFCRIKYLPQTYHLALFNETVPHHFMPHNMNIVVYTTYCGQEILDKIDKCASNIQNYISVEFCELWK